MNTNRQGVTIFTSSQTGPNTVIIGGTHGDERVGVEVVKKLNEWLSLKKDFYGSITCVFGNPKAIELRQRGTTSGRDLNRYFIDEDLQATPTENDTYDLIRARELSDVLRKADIVLDIHGTSSPSPAFLACGKPDERFKTLTNVFDVQSVLVDSDHIIAKDLGLPVRGTIDYFVEKHGGCAIVYETGKEDDLTRLDIVFKEVLAFLQQTNGLKDETIQVIKKPAHQQTFYLLRESVQATSIPFVFLPETSNGFSIIKNGQIIGSYEDGRSEYATCDGVILFPKAIAKQQKGANLFYLASIM